jgi:hypothetical protein
MKKITCFILILISLRCYPQDSLYLSADKPASVHEDNPLELGTVIRSAKPGQITHIKFYCVDPGKYTVTIWSVTGSSLLSQVIQATTGWQRFQLSTPFEVAVGDQYVISYLTNMQYGYSKSQALRTVGNITQLATRYSYGHKLPAVTVPEGYFIDVVFKEQQTRKPLIVNPGIDTAYRLPKDSVVYIHGIVTGDSVRFKWFVVDSAGTFQLSGLETLNPVIKTKEPCTLIMLLSGEDKYGAYLSIPIQIDVLPDPKTRRGTIEFYIDGTYKIIDEPNYFLMKSKSQ